MDEAMCLEGVGEARDAIVPAVDTYHSLQGVEPGRYRVVYHHILAMPTAEGVVNDEGAGLHHRVVLHTLLIDASLTGGGDQQYPHRKKEGEGAMQGSHTSRHMVGYDWGN